MVFAVVVVLLAGAGVGWAYRRGLEKEGSGPAPLRVAEPVASEVGFPAVTGGSVEVAAPVTEGVAASVSVVPSVAASASPRVAASASASVAAASAATSPAVVGKANPKGVNLALAGAATASAVEGDPWLPANAIDGDATSRWSSGFSDPQWIIVDLKEQWQLSQVTLEWEHAYGVSYRIETSIDGKKWTAIYSTKAGKGGSVTVDASAAVARYVRMYGTERNSIYGYSLLELEVR
ncbi:F5/8 type C domain-containing protein [Actinoplanes lutulentus]|uniref:F5/8 type C domain-containing protein n=1 Tax=Actinoplanes lutulentus TaxID=1287878 RepID=A0A327ZE37_9ACTN|nr:F5/8 type C domain-containing protein [Actinoplanes lutulentus]